MPLPILSAQPEESHEWRQDATTNWRSFLQKVIQAQRTAELLMIHDSMTQDLLRQLQEGNEG